jgi:hypothetical protein
MTWSVSANGQDAEKTIKDLEQKLEEPLFVQGDVADAIVKAVTDLAASLLLPITSASTSGKIGEDGKGSITVTVTAG